MMPLSHSIRSSFLIVLAGASITSCRPAAGATAEATATPTSKSPRDSIVRASVRRVLDRALADSSFPGAIAIVGSRSGVMATYAVGHLDWAPSPAPDEHTLWDLASLSKVVGLTSAMMQLVEQRRVDLDAPLQRYLPNWTGPNKERVTVRHLLTHTSGLPAFKAYDEITHDADSLAKLMFATPLDTVPGVRMVYSDIGAYMLGRLVERISGQTLDSYVHDHVFAPLRMTETMYKPPASLLSRIAPTEVDPRRGGLVRGKVHDERAYYLGGVSAHAGIFSSAHDLARFARMYLNGGALDGVRTFGQPVIAQFTAYADSTFSNRGIGWQKPDLPGMPFASPSAAWAGQFMSTTAFGHTGFTGTSIAIDPVNDVFIVLLTNRVNPTRNNNKITGVRRQLADAVMMAIRGTTNPQRSSP
jgi:CubicO group peptidase (beta-lactamase class C family)